MEYNNNYRMEMRIKLFDALKNSANGKMYATRLKIC